MQVEEAVEIVLDQRARGKRSPEALRGQLTVDEAYRVQDRVASRLTERGHRQAGWKIGGNSARFRATYAGAQPMRGYLFEDARYASGARIDYSALTVLPRMESELCFTIERPLEGDSVCRAEVLAAVGAIAAAFEIPCVIANRGVDLVAAGKLDIPMCIADNANTFLHVIGPALRPYPARLDLQEIFVQETCNDRISQQGRARDSIDDQLESIAWLARHLSAYGLAIEPGQYILSGNCCAAALKASAGETWQTTFSEVGSVAVEFA